jgi:hypothetical protein
MVGADLLPVCGFSKNNRLYRGAIFTATAKGNRTWGKFANTNWYLFSCGAADTVTGASRVVFFALRRADVDAPELWWKAATTIARLKRHLIKEDKCYC